MSTVSNTPLIVIERHKLNIPSDEDESDDEVFVNQTAVALDGEDPLLFSSPSHLGSVSLQSTGFLKLSSTVQFVRKWAERVARPLDYHESAPAITHVKPSMVLNNTTSLPAKPKPEESAPIEYLPLLQSLKQRLIWNPNGNFLYL